MKFLIPTEPDDCHAVAVKLALKQNGHDVALLFTADLPTKQRNSVFINNEHFYWKSTDAHRVMGENNYDVVWWRRARKPFLPKGRTHPEDYHFILRENALFFESITNTIASNAWWVNSKDAATRANAKLVQLKMAAECDLQIPVTLCSNDPKDIRYFLLKHEKEGVIYKPLCTYFWFEPEHIKISYTTKINFLNLPSNQLLQLSPGIFQKEVKKEYELRVVCFGHYLVSAKLYSQHHDDGKMDWRAITKDKMRIEPYELPSSIKLKIQCLMHKLGLVFAAIDLIVTPDGEYVFLEVNEQGQFLWMEDYNLQFSMLDIFVNFITNRSVDFTWNPEKNRHRLSQYNEEVDRIVKQNKRYHVELNSEEFYQRGRA